MFPNWESSIDMRLIGKHNLKHVIESDDLTRKWVLAWVAELTHANWKEPSDVFHQFPKVRLLDASYFAFPINSADKEVCIQIAFQQGIAVIIGVQ
ncbi:MULTISPECIES: type II toxin-antitoxin system HigB family toxin [Shewanella]|nr:type II toxin-antitoxin system HigB family toxin [Shewanella putrefaciens]